MLFFFYGTLVAGSGNPVARTAHAGMCRLGPAVTRGRLYAIADRDGWYPAILPGHGEVKGVLYRARRGFGRRELIRLDAYEDFDPMHPKGSLYLRKAATVNDSTGNEWTAQAYLFNQPLPPSARPIRSGDFHGWLRKTGYRAFAASRAV